MATRIAIIDLVALTDDQLADMPRLASLMSRGTRGRLQPVLPAVTCTSQASMLTGHGPAEHGIVGNGWHDRARAETRFWQQSNHLVQREQVWDRLGRLDEDITWANCFWWFAMYSRTKVAVTPRPMYRADGRKIPDIWTHPSDLRDTLERELGRFPLFHFWGPAADITSSQWIADAARRVESVFDPTVLAVYLPHLDYGLQKLGPDSPGMVNVRREIDDVAADLIEHLVSRGRHILVVNEYGVMPVRGSVAPNLALREAGLLAIRTEQGREYLDAGASDAFAVPDHQIAHVHVRHEDDRRRVAELLGGLDGVDGIIQDGLGHERSGDLVLVAREDRWFRHDWWLEDRIAPDFQRTVDIHRKPGYDPRELFIDPAIAFPSLAIGWRLLRKRLGFRGLLDVIPLDADLVRGSHGRCDPEFDPLFWCSEQFELPERMPMTAVADLIEQMVLG